MLEAGFTLVEIVIAVAIVATTVAAGFGISLASRSLAVSTAAGELDQFLDSARTMARDLDGATLAFTADAYGDGTEVRLLAGGPNGPPAPTTLPTLHTRAAIEETESLGKVPFAFVVHANGSLSGRPGYRVGDAATNDVGCPASGAFHFVIRAAGASADRFVPCTVKLAANGPVTLTAWPQATPAPNPTPCGGPGCTATALPSVPVSPASCPPSFTAISGGCMPPSSPGSGARYHVTITDAPATIAVGATGTLTAQATLTNPNAVPPGTPASIPVQVQTADPTCAVTPTDWQSSGSAFTATGAAAGVCTLTATGDPSGAAGATSDTGSVSITITAAAGVTPAPSPRPCDLVANGKCYHRIVEQTSQVFKKAVFPDDNCGTTAPETSCKYIDSIRAITLDEYSFTPPTPPVDELHELLFRIDRIDNVVYGCQPFSTVAAMVPTDIWNVVERGIGGAANGPLGFGMPGTYATINHVFAGAVPGSFDERNFSGAVVPNLFDLIDTIARARTAAPYAFTFYSVDAASNSKIIWFPDFPSCDNLGDPLNYGVEFGSVSAALTFEVFQAT